MILHEFKKAKPRPTWGNEENCRDSRKRQRGAGRMAVLSGKPGAGLQKRLENWLSPGGSSPQTNPSVPLNFSFLRFHILGLKCKISQVLSFNFILLSAVESVIPYVLTHINEEAGFLWILFPPFRPSHNPPKWFFYSLSQFPLKCVDMTFFSVAVTFCFS